MNEPADISMHLAALHGLPSAKGDQVAGQAPLHAFPKPCSRTSSPMYAVNFFVVHSSSVLIYFICLCAYR